MSALSLNVRLVLFAVLVLFALSSCDTNVDDIVVGAGREAITHMQENTNNTLCSGDCRLP